MFSSCSSKFFAHFHIDAVVPSSYLCCIETGLRLFVGTDHKVRDDLQLSHFVG